MVHKEKQAKVNFNLYQTNSWWMNYNQYLHPKQNLKQITHESNKLCMLQSGKKSIRSVKRKIISVAGDVRWEMFSMSVR